jgi:hypothetical protein
LQQIFPTSRILEVEAQSPPMKEYSEQKENIISGISTPRMNNPTHTQPIAQSALLLRDKIGAEGWTATEAVTPEAMEGLLHRNNVASTHILWGLFRALLS